METEKEQRSQLKQNAAAVSKLKQILNTSTDSSEEESTKQHRKTNKKKQKQKKIKPFRKTSCSSECSSSSSNSSSSSSCTDERDSDDSSSRRSSKSTEPKKKQQSRLASHQTQQISEFIKIIRTNSSFYQNFRRCLKSEQRLHSRIQRSSYKQLFFDLLDLFNNLLREASSPQGEQPLPPSHPLQSSSIFQQKYPASSSSNLFLQSMKQQNKQAISLNHLYADNASDRLKQTPQPLPPPSYKHSKNLSVQVISEATPYHHSSNQRLTGTAQSQHSKHFEWNSLILNEQGSRQFTSPKEIARQNIGPSFSLSPFDDTLYSQSDDFIPMATANSQYQHQAQRQESLLKQQQQQQQSGGETNSISSKLGQSEEITRSMKYLKENFILRKNRDTQSLDLTSDEKHFGRQLAFFNQQQRGGLQIDMNQQRGTQPPEATTGGGGTAKANSHLILHQIHEEPTTLQTDNFQEKTHQEIIKHPTNNKTKQHEAIVIEQEKKKKKLQLPSKKPLPSPYFSIPIKGGNAATAVGESLDSLEHDQNNLNGSINSSSQSAGINVRTRQNSLPSRIGRLSAKTTAMHRIETSDFKPQFNDEMIVYHVMPHLRERYMTRQTTQIEPSVIPISGSQSTKSAAFQQINELSRETSARKKQSSFQIGSSGIDEEN